MQIFVSQDLTDTQLETMEAIAQGDRLHLYGEFDDDAPVPEQFTGCEVAMGNVPAPWLEQTKTLRWMQLLSVGFGEYEHLDWATLAKQTTVTNLAGFFAEPVAQTVLAGVLALHRRIDEVSRLKAHRDWQKDALRAESRVLTGVHVLLAGYGSIGRRLAELLAPFGCRLTRYDLSANADLSTPEQLDSVLPDVDVIVVALPQSSKTNNLFDARRLALLKATAVFINVGRGTVVEEAALVDSLTSRRLGGAVLDVTLEEPLPEDHPLWDCPNTILTQHTAGGTVDEIDRKIDVFADNLGRYRAGEPLVGVVDWERGY